MIDKINELLHLLKTERKEIDNGIKTCIALTADTVDNIITCLNKLYEHETIETYLITYVTSTETHNPIKTHSLSFAQNFMKKKVIETYIEHFNIDEFCAKYYLVKCDYTILNKYNLVDDFVEYICKQPNNRVNITKSNGNATANIIFDDTQLISINIYDIKKTD